MLKILQSDNPKSHFAPKWKAELFHSSLNNKEICTKLEKIILNHENEIIEKNKDVYNDGGTGLGKDTLTSKFGTFNLFSWHYPEIETFKSFVLREYKNFLHQIGLDEEKCYIQCWANVLRAGEQIQPHWHSSGPDTYLSGHFCVKTIDSSTLYQNPFKPDQWVSFDNNIGDLLFFPSWMVHKTSKVGEECRITIAFDLIQANLLEEQLYPQNFCKFNF